MQRLSVIAGIVGLFFIVSLPSTAQQVTQKRKEKTRILFLVDGSNSMYGAWESRQKIDAAKDLLNNLVDSLRVNKNLELALRIYGHRYSLDNRNCEDTRLEVPFAPDNHSDIIAEMNDLVPQGTTPIAYSLEQAAGDFPQSDQFRNIVIIITDGVESCGGDPCAVSLALQRAGVYLKPFIIGLSMQEDYDKEFECIGTYFDARKIADFRTALDLALKQSLSETTVSVELLDDQNQPTETNINISFLNHLTGLSEYDFVHYRDQNGQTDSLEIEPILTYDFVANTIPPVRLNGVQIIGGEHNTFSMKTPQGFLNVDFENSSRYEYGVEMLIRLPGKKDILHVQHVDETGKYLAGSYDVEVLTLPKTRFRNVKINYKKTTTLTIEAPGLLNLISPSYIFATIYEIDDAGKEVWITNLDTKNTTTKLAMQSGSYKIAYRSKNTFGSKFTNTKLFTIRSKIATSLKLFE